MSERKFVSTRPSCYQLTDADDRTTPTTPVCQPRNCTTELLLMASVL